MKLSLRTLLLLSAAGLAPAAQLVIEPSLLPAHVGQTLTVSVVAKNVTDLWAYQLEVNYPNFLFIADAATDVTEPQGLTDPFGPNGVFFISGFDDGSKIGLIGNARNVPEGFTGASATLVQITFGVLAPGIGDITVTPSSSSTFLLDSSVSDLPDFDAATDTYGATVTALEADLVPEPSIVWLVSAGLALCGMARLRRWVA
jgi:hypothetical protein